MSAFTTDTLDEAVMAGYCFRAVIDALNTGDFAEAGLRLHKVLAERAADEEPRYQPTAAGIAAVGGRLAIVPVMEAKP